MIYSKRLSRMPVLLLLKGQPGSGKSTLARALARRLQWALIDKDDARDAFQQLAEQEPGIDWNALSYDVMFRYAHKQLGVGMSVIFDCPLARRQLYDRAQAMAHETGATIVLVECIPKDTEVWRRRVAFRGEQDSGTDRAHKPGSWEAVQKVMERNSGSERWSEGVQLSWRAEVDTTAPLDQQLAQVLALVDGMESEG